MSQCWKSMRVLVVEDDVLAAMALVDHLHALGAEVIGPVADINRALQLAQHAQLSGAILDVNIHGGETWPVAGILIARDIPIVFATGSSHTQDAASFANVPWFTKPYDPAAVTDALLTRITAAARPDPASDDVDLLMGSYCCSPMRTLMAV